MHVQKLFHRLLRTAQGVALIEFAFVLPILMLLLFGALEISRAMIITQRVEKVAYALADVTSQYPPATAERLSGEISETELRTNVFPQFERIMGTYADTTRQNMILTSVVREGATNRIKWQIAGGGTLTRNVTSVVNGLAPSAIGVGVMNQTATFSGDGEVAREMQSSSDGENVIIAEIFYQYQPIWTQAIGAIPTSEGEEITIARAKLLTKRMYFRPRNGSLICLPNTFVYNQCVGTNTPGPGGGGFQCGEDQCEVSGGLYSGNSCLPCANNGIIVQSVGEFCSRFICRRGQLQLLGAGRGCTFDQQCEEGD